MIKITRPECPNPTALVGGNYKHPDNKLALKNSSFDKCMYCECKISHIDFAHVEHIKPKSPDKYPELEFEWTNLGYACPKCNNEKHNKYHEDTPYINPYVDDPNNYVHAFGTFIFSKNGNERAEITITDLKLNRKELLERRMLRINDIKRSIDACNRTSSETLRTSALEEIQREAEDNRELSLFVKSYLSSNDS